MKIVAVDASGESSARCGLGEEKRRKKKKKKEKEKAGGRGDRVLSSCPSRGCQGSIDGRAFTGSRPAGSRQGYKGTGGWINACDWLGEQENTF